MWSTDLTPGMRWSIASTRDPLRYVPFDSVDLECSGASDDTTTIRVCVVRFGYVVVATSFGPQREEKTNAGRVPEQGKTP